jgi:hypothetical protein
LCRSKQGPLKSRVVRRTGAKPAGLRAESRPAHQRRPRRCRGTGPPPNTFAPRYSHSDHGRSRQSLGHPTDLPPLDAPSSALANNRAPPTGRRDVSTPARGEKLPPPRRLPHLFIPLCRSRFHTTRYRTTHFDNLRRTWKSRMYWEYTKTSDLVNPKSKARAKLSCRLKGLIG